jgi:hypothetical protein
MITHSILDNAQCASRFPVYPPASAPLESIHGTSSFRPAFFADSSTQLVCNGSRHFTFPGGRVFDWRSTSLVLTPSSAVDQIYRLMAIVVMLGGILPPTCPAVPRTLGLYEALVYIESRTLPHADVIPISNDIRAQSGVKVQGTVLPPVRVGPSGNAGLPLSVAGNVRWVATLQGCFGEVEHGWVGTIGSIGRFTTGPECFIIKWADQNQVDRVIGISSGSYVGRDAHGFSMERIQAKRTRACLWWNRH